MKKIRHRKRVRHRKNPKPQKHMAKCPHGVQYTEYNRFHADNLWEVCHQCAIAEINRLKDEVTVLRNEQVYGHPSGYDL